MDAVGAVFRRIHNDQLVYDFQRLCGVRKIEQDNADKSVMRRETLCFHEAR